MSQAIVIFNFKGKKLSVSCTTSETMMNICEKYTSKIQENLNELIFIYNNNLINKNLKFEEQINELDKDKYSMNIIVEEINEEISEEVICPECNENISINVDNYKIKMNKCKNGHIYDEVAYEEFINFQKLDVSKIKCEMCKENNKSNSKEMFNCITCNNILCTTCKENHDNNHIIINYEKRNLVCNKHNDFFTKYCKNCEINICLNCEREHKNHNTIYFGDIIPDEFNENEFKKYIEKLKNEINSIIKKLKKIKNNIDIYYNTSNNILKNKKRNYEIIN